MTPTRCLTSYHLFDNDFGLRFVKNFGEAGLARVSVLALNISAY